MIMNAFTSYVWIPIMISASIYRSHSDIVRESVSGRLSSEDHGKGGPSIRRVGEGLRQRGADDGRAQ